MLKLREYNEVERLEAAAMDLCRELAAMTYAEMVERLQENETYVEIYTINRFNH